MYYALRGWRREMITPVGRDCGRRGGVRIAMTRALFAWDCLEDSPSLGTVREFLGSVPDGKLLESLRSWRGRGRDDYPVGVLWGTVLLTIVLRHPSIESCLGEFCRNRGLRELVGIRDAGGVPKKWNVSRFLVVLGTEPHRSLLRGVFDEMARRLGEAVGDLGRDCAGDASHLSARNPAHGRDGRDERAGGTKRFDRLTALSCAEGLLRCRRVRGSCSGGEDGLPEAAGGRKEYVDEEGNITRVLEWFGYKFHLLVDTRHEVALAYRISSTKAGDNEILPELLTQAQANLPTRRIRTLSYDKAADDEKVHALLDGASIAPVIENRSLWRGEFERMLPGHDGRSNVVYDEAGTLYCYDKTAPAPVRHRMAYIGHEPSRGTLKYRCPAMHEGWRCGSNDRCNAGRKYGKTVRVRREIDLRRFPPIPRATKQFERLYRGRTAVERVNARLKVFWGADDGNITGARRFHAFLGAVMVVHLGLATLLASTPRHEGTLGRMRLGPIAEALRRKMKG